jgi:hypothetical protein
MEDLEFEGLGFEVGRRLLDIMPGKADLYELPVEA